MNILIVVPKFCPDPFYYYDFPIGLAYISATLKREGYQVDILNLNEYYGPLQTHDWAPLEMLLKRRLQVRQYDILCTGGLANYHDEIKAIVAKINKLAPEVVTIVGGGLISSEPELVMQSVRPTYGVLGEGEETITELMHCIGHSLPCSEIEGIAYFDGKADVTITPPRAAIADINALPFPDYEGFDINHMIKNTLPADLHGYYFSDTPRVIPIVTSRSCPFKCTFCFHPLGNKYRQRSMDSVFEEIEYLVTNYQINMIMILDELFGYNNDYLLQFCQRIKKLNIKWGAQMHLSHVSEEMLKIMRDAGCIILSYGLESASDVVLKSMKKHLSVEQMEKGLEATYNCGIQIQGNFIFGDPAETAETVNQTMDWWQKHRKYMINLSRVIPFPGSELWKQGIANGRIPDKYSHIVNTCGALYYVNISSLDQAQYQELLQKLDYIDTVVDRMPGRVVSCLKHGFHPRRGPLYQVEVECPHCQELNLFRNIHDADIKNRQRNLRKRMGCKKCNQRFDILFPVLETEISKLLVESSSHRMGILGADLRAEVLLTGSPTLRERVVAVISENPRDRNCALENVPIFTTDQDEKLLSGLVDTVIVTSNEVRDRNAELLDRLSGNGVSVKLLFSTIDESINTLVFVHPDCRRNDTLLNAYHKGLRHSELGEHNEAFKLHTDLIGILPTEANAHLDLAYAALSAKEYNTALDALYTAQLLSPRNPSVLKALSEFSAPTGELGTATKACAEPMARGVAP